MRGARLSRNWGGEGFRGMSQGKKKKGNKGKNIENWGIKKKEKKLNGKEEQKRKKKWENQINLKMQNDLMGELWRERKRKPERKERKQESEKKVDGRDPTLA